MGGLLFFMPDGQRARKGNHERTEQAERTYTRGTGAFESIPQRVCTAVQRKEQRTVQAAPH